MHYHLNCLKRGLFDSFLRVHYDWHCFGNAGSLQGKAPPKQFVLWPKWAMPEYQWFTDHSRVHQDRTSC